MRRKGLIQSLVLAVVLLSAPFVLAAENVIDDREGSSERALPLMATPKGARETSAAAGHTPYSMFAGVMATGNNGFVLRVTNRGPRAGTATVVFVSAANGATLGRWTSSSIPVFASVQSSIASIAALMTPALTPAQLAAPMNVLVSTTFAPATQLLAFNGTTGGIANLTACGGNLFEDIYLLGYVEGPGAVGPTAAVRMVNTSSRTLSARLTLYNSGSGVSLGTWNSQDIPPGASITMSAAAIAAAATPAIPASMPAMTVLALPVRGLRLEHVVMSNGMLTDLTSACSP